MKQIPRFWARTTGEKKGDLALHQKRVEVKRSQPIVEALFEDAVVLITGAGSGIGQSCAHQFARYGCRKLFLVDISLSSLEKTKKDILSNQAGIRVELYQGDVSGEASVKGMIGRCVDLYGRIDIACNNAGISGGSARTSDLPVRDFDLLCTVNQLGVFLCEKYELRQMLQQDPALSGQRGSIINVSSVAGNCIIPTTPAYTASKHAVVALSRCDALKYAQDGIRVNCVSPSAVWTPMVSGAGLPQEFLDMGAAQSPLKRYLQPMEVANAILFIASPNASAILGANLPIDGGTQLLCSF